MILDTNALSAMADGNESLRIQLANTATLYVPVIALGEYCYGIALSKHRRRYEEWLNDALRYLVVLPVGDATIPLYVRICLALRERGTPIPANDVWIAAIAAEHNLPLISQDRHFDLVPHLRRITW